MAQRVASDSWREDQNEEITALKSIFEDCIRFPKGDIDGETKGRREPSERLHIVQVLVHVHLAEEKVTIEAWMPVDEDETEASQYPVAEAQSSLSEAASRQPAYRRSDSGQRILATVTVEHLPPLLLECTLPTTYPASSPPIFTLSCSWLDASQLSSLCKKLDHLWEASPGQPVIFTWVDWLQNNTANHLCLTDMIIVAPYHSRGSEISRDPRAIPECYGIEATLMSLLRYDFEQGEEDFRQSHHLCGVCLEEQLGSKFFRVSGCSHPVCFTCMQNYCSLFVQEGSVLHLKCPHPKCNQPLPPDAIRSVLGDEEYERWERLVFQKSLDVMEDVEYCPRCQMAVVRDDLQTNHALCAHCFYSFCIECQQSWHLDACLSDEQRLAQKLKAATAEGQSSGEQKAPKLSEADRRRLREEYLSSVTLKTAARKCPSCKTQIQKIEGCNKMTCTMCRANFCYVCGGQIKGYDHFQGSGCSLFTMDPPVLRVPERQRPEAAIRLEEELRRDPAARQRVRPCPRCRQRNLKESRNNHMKCWSCKTNFCYACMKTIDSTVSAHYGGKNTCPQHSAD